MLKRLIFEEEGQTLVEYGLLISLIALVVVATVGLLGTRLLKYFENADNKLPFNHPPG